MLARRFLLAIAVVLCAGLTAGCPDKKPKYPACDSDQDCQGGQRCINKMCVECGDDSHCPAGEACESGKCVVPEGACTSDEQCDDSQVCKDGRCSACADDAECGPGGKCSAGACERPKACQIDEDCEDDEDCIEGRCLKPWKSPDSSVSCTFQPVYFEFDQAAIPAESREFLTELAACLGQVPASRAVSLHGHTDEIGTEEYNIALSERRARSVADYLARLGVDAARLHIVPKGRSEPTGRGNAADRRVEFEWR